MGDTNRPGATVFGGGCFSFYLTRLHFRPAPERDCQFEFSGRSAHLRKLLSSARDAEVAYADSPAITGSGPDAAPKPAAMKSVRGPPQMPRAPSVCWVV